MTNTEAPARTARDIAADQLAAQALASIDTADQAVLAAIDALDKLELARHGHEDSDAAYVTRDLLRGALRELRKAADEAPGRY